MTEDREIINVTVAGRIVPAALVICPHCFILDLGTDFDVDDPIEWKLTCGNGHTWALDPTDLQLAEPEQNVYERFIEETEGMTVMAEANALEVIDRFTRAVKRSQMVVDGELPPFHERLLAGWDMSNY